MTKTLGLVGWTVLRIVGAAPHLTPNAFAHASVDIREVPLAIEALQYVQPWMLPRWGSGRRLPRAKRLRAFIAQSNWRRDAYFTWQRTGIHQYQSWIETPSPWPLRTL